MFGVVYLMVAVRLVMHNALVHVCKVMVRVGESLA